MPDLSPQDTLLMHSARIAYRSLRGGYRQARAFKNRISNLFDPPVIILIYHRVAELLSDPEMLAVSPLNFRKQLDYLKQNWRIVRFEDDWTGLQEPAVAVTFDDGYVDNLHAALPILERAEVPATFFVSTGRLGTDRVFWWNELEEMLLRGGELPPRFSLQDSRFGRAWDTVTPEQRRRLYAALSQLMHQVDHQRRENWLGQLRDWSSRDLVRESPHRCMTQEELQTLAASPWATIGAHTVTHSALSALSEAQQRTEIVSSRLDLEKILGEEVATFSYPFGRKVDYNRTSVRLCREAGFAKVASNFPGQVHRWTDPLQLPRHLIRDWDETTFAAEMKKFWTR
jgi:peptidoglycan/xylan/chitin deacetylase (PgdA/CDA1 family)